MNKYFDRGLREYLVDDYHFVGIIMAIAVQLTAFTPVDVINSLVVSPSGNPCIAYL